MSTATPAPAPRTSYQSNSKAASEASSETIEKAEPRIKKIEGVTVTQTKPSLGKRIKESFGGQNLKDVGHGLLFEVVLPGARDIIFDMIKEGAHRSLYGDTARRSSSSSFIGGGGTRIRSTNYSSMSKSPLVGNSARSEQSMSPQQRARFDFSDLLIEEADKAEEILMEMENAILEFGVVTVADFYDAIGESGNGFTDQKFGWDTHTFSGAKAVRVRGGYILDIPAPKGIQ